MTKLAALDGGTYFHKRALHGERFGGYFDALIDIRELATANLAAYDVLIVTDRTHPGKLREAQARLHGFLAKGGTLVVMGETQPHTWLPYVKWHYRPTNFWWWREPGADSGLVASAPAHPLFRYITLADATWHYHGVLEAPAGATPLIELKNQTGCLLYEDRVSTDGALVVTTLDPFYHYGSYFMPVTERFLEGFLAWIKTAVDGRDMKFEVSHNRRKS
jgi:hypothetical protein